MLWRRSLPLAGFASTVLRRPSFTTFTRLLPSRYYAMVPNVIEHPSRYYACSERACDIFSPLLQERIICINGPIYDDTAAVVVAQLLFLESKDSLMPINLYINSPGGAVTAGLSIYDTMQYIRPPVITLCPGIAASIGSLLLAAGAPGERRALPNSRLMIHQPSSSDVMIHQPSSSDVMIHQPSGDASDIAAKEILNVRERLNAIYVKHTGQQLSCIEQSMKRDMFMSPEEAKEFGLIDEVIEHRREYNLFSRRK